METDSYNQSYTCYLILVLFLQFVFFITYVSEMMVYGVWQHFQQYFSYMYIVVVSFIDGGNQSTRRKPPTCRKSLTNLITLCYIEYTSEMKYVVNQNRKLNCSIIIQFIYIFAGGLFIQQLAQRLKASWEDMEGKYLDNVLLLFAHLYNFKVCVLC